MEHHSILNKYPGIPGNHSLGVRVASCVDSWGTDVVKGWIYGRDIVLCEKWRIKRVNSGISSILL